MKKTVFTILSIVLLLALTSATYANIEVFARAQDDGTVRLGIRIGGVSGLGCIISAGVVINNYAFNKSKWQRRGENGTWLDVPGTETSGMCALTPDQPGEYRWVAEGKRDGIAGTYVSNNTVVVGGDNVQETNPNPVGTGPKVLVVDLDSPPIYWSDKSTGKIYRVNLDGSNVEDLVIQGLDESTDIALDVVSGKMYWTNYDTDQIQRANLDGSNIEDLVTQGLDGPAGIALDVAGGKMYWVNTGLRADLEGRLNVGTQKIQRANLDGSNVEDLVTRGLEHPDGIALDVVSGKMYWMDWDTDKIQRANLDGSNVEDLITRGLDGPADIALDVVSGKMYWTDRDTDKIQRANLDGSNVEDLVTRDLEWPTSIALDVVSGKIYWSDWGTQKI